MLPPDAFYSFPFGTEVVFDCPRCRARSDSQVDDVDCQSCFWLAFYCSDYAVRRAIDELTHRLIRMECPEHWRTRGLLEQVVAAMQRKMSHRRFAGYRDEERFWSTFGRVAHLRIRHSLELEGDAS